MKKLTILIAGLIIAAIMIVPVMADSTSQNAGGVIVGNDNKQVVNNNNKQTDINQDATTVVNGGHDNTAIAQNTAKGDIVNGNVVNGATSVSNSQNVAIIMESAPNHYALDTPMIESQITSLYDGEVLVVPIDGGVDTPFIQKHGETYRFGVTSALPVLIYVINSNDDDMVTTLSGAPVYDSVRKKFDHSNVFVYMKSKIRSTQQALYFTVKDAGRYSFVIDTRVSQNLNGELSQISPSSVDIAYSLEKTAPESAVNESKQYTGKTEVYQTMANGQADNTKDIILRSY